MDVIKKEPASGENRKDVVLTGCGSFLRCGTCEDYDGDKTKYMDLLFIAALRRF